MQLTAKQSVWLSNPQCVLTVNLEDGDTFAGQVTMAAPDTDMTEFGWVKLGIADCAFTVTMSSTQIKTEAIARLREAIAKEEQKHFERVQAMNEVVNKMLAIGMD